MRNLIIFILLIFSIVQAFSDVEVRVGAVTSVDFASLPKPEEVIIEFASPDPGLYWGFGWEVILDKIGLGGDYLVDFIRSDNREWSVEWLSQPLYLSYHLFGAMSFLDVFGQIGLGCAGSVYIGDPATGSWAESTGYPEALSISIFPYVACGAAINLSGIVVGARVSYAPMMTPPPVTPFEPYPLNDFQVAIFVSASLGVKESGCNEGCE